MAHILARWLNEEIKLSAPIDTGTGGLDRYFQSGYFLGELFYHYSLQPDFHKTFTRANNLESAIKNYIQIAKTLRDHLDIELSPGRAYQIIMVQPGAAAQLIYDIKAKIYRKRMTPCTAKLENSKLTTSEERYEPSGKNGVDFSSPLRTPEVGFTTTATQNKAKYMDMEHRFFAERLKGFVKRGDRELFLDVQTPKVQPHDGLKQALLGVRSSHRRTSPLPPVKSLKKQSANDFAFSKGKQNANKAERSGQSHQDFKLLQQKIDQFEQQQNQDNLFSKPPRQLFSNESESSLEVETQTNVVPKNLTVVDSPVVEKQDTAEIACEDHSEDASSDFEESARKTQTRIREKRLEAEANRKGREQRRRKLLLSQQSANLDIEKAKYEELLLKNLLHQSRQEQRMTEQLALSRKEKEVMIQNYQFREQQYQERRQKDFEEALERERELVSRAREDYRRQLEMQLEQHQTLLARKAHVKHLKNLEFCTKVLSDLVELSFKMVDYKALQAVADSSNPKPLVPLNVLQEWKTLFAHGQPLGAVYDFDTALEVVPLLKQIQDHTTAAAGTSNSGSPGHSYATAPDNMAASATGSRSTLLKSHSKSSMALASGLPVASATNGNASPSETGKADPLRTLQEKLARFDESVPAVVRRGIDILDNASLDFYIANQGQWTYTSPNVAFKEEQVVLPNPILSNYIHKVIDMNADAAAAAEAEACRLAGQKYQWGLRIALVGKRYSGRTSLAQFISKCFGLEVIDISNAVDSMIRALDYSLEEQADGKQDLSLSKKLQSTLLQGKELDDATLVQVAVHQVQALEEQVKKNNYDKQSSANGFVLVDFPRNRYQAAMFEKELTGFEEPKPVVRGNFKKATIGAHAPAASKDDIKTAPHPSSALGKGTRSSQASAGKAVSQIVPNANATQPTKVESTSLSVLDAVIYLETPDSDCFKRAVGRRHDPVTGAIYHLDFNPPPSNVPGLLERLVSEESIPIEQLQYQIANFNENLPGLQDWYSKVLQLWNPVNTSLNSQTESGVCNVVFEQVEGLLANLIKARQHALVPLGETTAGSIGFHAMPASNPSNGDMQALTSVATNIEQPKDSVSSTLVTGKSSALQPRPALTPAKNKSSVDLHGKSPVAEHEKISTPGNLRLSNAARIVPSPASSSDKSNNSLESNLAVGTTTNFVESSGGAAVALDASTSNCSVEDGLTVKVACAETRKLPSKDAVKVLADHWGTIEDHYSLSMKFFFRNLRRQRESMQRYLCDSRQKFKSFLNRPDMKQELVNLFQVEYNEIDDELRSDLDAKAELHQRTEDLREKLWNLTDSKRESALHERQSFVEEKFVDESFVTVSNFYIGAMQAELDRFVETRQFIIEYIKECYGQVPESLCGVGSIKLPISTHAPTELSAIFAALLVPIEGGNFDGNGSTSAAVGKASAGAGALSAIKGSAGSAGAGILGKGVSSVSSADAAANVSGVKRMTSSTNKKVAAEVGITPNVASPNAPVAPTAIPQSKTLMGVLNGGAVGGSISGSNPALNAANISAAASIASSPQTIADFQALYKDITVAFEVAQTVFSFIESASNSKVGAAGVSNSPALVLEKARRNTVSSSGASGPASERPITSLVDNSPANGDGSSQGAGEEVGTLGSSVNAGVNSLSAQSWQEVTEEALTAFELEERTLKWRLERLQALAIAHLRDIRSRAAALYVQLDEWTANRFQTEIDAIRELIGVVRTAIETEMKLPNELLLKGEEFLIDFTSQLLQVPRVVASFKNDESLGSDFSWLQILNISRYLAKVSPSGTVAIVTCAESLQSLALQQQLRTGEVVSVLPSVLLQAPPKLFNSVLEAFDIFQSGIIDWRRFLYSYSPLMLQSMVPLVAMRQAMGAKKTLTMAEFQALPWSEWISEPRQEVIKLFVVAMFYLFAQSDGTLAKSSARLQEQSSAVFTSAEPQVEQAVRNPGVQNASFPVSSGRRRSSFAPLSNSPLIEEQTVTAASVPEVVLEEAGKGKPTPENGNSAVDDSSNPGGEEGAASADTLLSSHLRSTLWTFEDAVYVYDNLNVTNDLRFDCDMFFCLASLDTDPQAGFRNAWETFRAQNEKESEVLGGGISLSLDETFELLHRDVCVSNYAKGKRTRSLNGSANLTLPANIGDPFPFSVLSFLFKLACALNIGANGVSLTFNELLTAASKGLNRDLVQSVLPSVAAKVAQSLKAAAPPKLEVDESMANASGSKLNLSVVCAKAADDGTTAEAQPFAEVSLQNVLGTLEKSSLSNLTNLVNSSAYQKTLNNLLRNPLWHYDCVNLGKLAQIVKPLE